MNLSGNALTMREVNLNLIRRALKARRQATKQQLAEWTGLSLMTVGTLMQQLVESGEAYETEQAPSSGGRPAHRFCFNEAYAHVLTLFTYEQEGRDLLNLRIANLYGENVWASDEEPGEIRLETFAPRIDACLLRVPTIRALGFGLPGFEVDGKIVALDYPALVGERLNEYYAQRYRLPVIFENDVNAAALGYCQRHNVSDEETLVYVYFPVRYPPGAGICLEGRLYRGSSNFAGEISHLPLGVDWHDPALYCSAERFAPALARVIVAVSSLLNPQRIVLHGEFLDEAALSTIRQLSAEALPPTALPRLALSEDFSGDYQAGMITETLACLEPTLSLTHSA
jgi:predicted NBD/HSP70 family sugar kinase